MIFPSGSVEKSLLISQLYRGRGGSDSKDTGSSIGKYIYSFKESLKTTDIFPYTYTTISILCGDRTLAYIQFNPLQSLEERAVISTDLPLLLQPTTCPHPSTVSAEGGRFSGLLWEGDAGRLLCKICRW